MCVLLGTIVYFVSSGLVPSGGDIDYRIIIMYQTVACSDYKLIYIIGFFEFAVI